jgi:lysine 2,3-aminomutase
VLGAVASEAIGPTDSHEHLFIRSGMPVLQSPDFLLTDYEKIATDAAQFKMAGGSAIVEMSPIDWGRDAERLVKLARATGLHIVAATGFHKTTYYPDHHWIHVYTEEDIAKLVCDELEVGMDLYNYSGPLVVQTAARAGVIKVGTRKERFSDTERKLLCVAAMAHLKTGAPIITHTDDGQMALEQIAFLTKLGVNSNRIALSHMDRRIDLTYHKEVASTGAFLEYDALTRVSKGFDKSTLRLIMEMFDAGHIGNILLGGDISRQGYWRSYGGAPGLDFLVGAFRSKLLQAGLPQDALDALYVRNPRALLTWSKGVPTAACEEVDTGHDAKAGGDGALGGDISSARQRTKLHSVTALVSRDLVKPEDAPAIETVASDLPIAITADLAALIMSSAADDPIGRQFVPSVTELNVDERELFDPIGDTVHARTDAVIHRYPDRVLIKVTHVCPVYCRFCFRREEIGPDSDQITEKELGEALAYVRAHSEVWEVILSGGDPLILSNRRLDRLFRALHEIKHVEVIRIHTRYPLADPQRITNELARLLRGRAAVYVVLHCNHPHELTAKARAACDRLIDNGIPMLSQTVLLRGVNDDAETMAQLMRALVRARIKPYYLHHLDLARGTGHFRTTIKKGQDIMRQLRGRVSGLCQPTYVLDIPGGNGKVPIGPSYIQPARSGPAYSVEDYKGREHGYLDLAEGSIEPALVPPTDQIVSHPKR